MRISRPALAVLGALAVATIALALSGIAALAPPGFHGTAYLPPEPAPAFTLTDQRGQSTALSDYRGKPVLLFFGFVNCPDVCPLTLQRLTRVLRSMEMGPREIQILLVTVDPARDDPEALRGFLSRFDPLVDGFTGDSTALAAVRTAYGVYAGPHPGNRHMAMTHTPAVFGIDAAGDLRVLLPMEQPDEVVAADIRTLAGL